jgi:hypothetical protein
MNICVQRVPVFTPTRISITLDTEDEERYFRTMLSIATRDCVEGSYVDQMITKIRTQLDKK